MPSASQRQPPLITRIHLTHFWLRPVQNRPCVQTLSGRPSIHPPSHQPNPSRSGAERVEAFQQTPWETSDAFSSPGHQWLVASLCLGVGGPGPENAYWFGGYTPEDLVDFVTEDDRSGQNQMPFSVFAQILFSCFLDLLK